MCWRMSVFLEGNEFVSRAVTSGSIRWYEGFDGMASAGEDGVFVKIGGLSIWESQFGSQEEKSGAWERVRTEEGLRIRGKGKRLIICGRNSDNGRDQW